MEIREIDEVWWLEVRLEGENSDLVKAWHANTVCFNHLRQVRVSQLGLMMEFT